MDNSELSAVWRYALALLIVAAATSLCFIDLRFSRGTPYLLFSPVPLLAWLCGGLGPGLLASVLSGLIVDYVLVPPYYSVAFQPADFIRLAMFVGSQIALCVLFDSRTKKLRRREEEVGGMNAELRRSEERLSSMIGTAMDAIITLDDDMNVVVFNNAAERVFRCSAAEALGKPLDRFLPQRFREAHREHIRRFGITGQSARSMESPAEIQGRRADGEEFPLEATISQVSSGGQKFYTVILRDLTLRKQNEELARQYAQNKELDKLKTKFFDNVSHELRTPLTLILGPVRKILAAGGLSEVHRRELELVERNANLLLAEVNDLLDLSKLDALRMDAEYAATDLARLGRVVASYFESLAKDRGVNYEIDLPASLPAQVDAPKLERVFLNLLSNAFKCTPASGRVRFAIHQHNDRALVEIEDTGPGIPAQMREAIFERFSHVDTSASRQFPATGLGLSIARQFVGLHRGTITVTEGACGGGSIFRVELPLLAPDGSRVKQTEAEFDQEPARQTIEKLAVRSVVRRAPALAPPAGAPLVLVIEDNPDVNAYVSETLSSSYRTVAAFDGEEGLKEAVELRPDLILCDIVMPGMSGDQVVRQLRQHQELEQVPIVLLTVKADDKLLVELLKEGAQDYLQKPFAPEQLLAKLGRLIADRRRVAGELERLRVLSGRLAQADDEERRLIAHELHENIAQSIAALGMSLSQARDMDMARSQQAQRIIHEGLSLLEMCSSDIRHMSELLHPSVLNFYGLEAAAESYLKSFQLRSGLEVIVDIAPDLVRLPAEAELALFRIMQAAVTNFHNVGQKRISVRVCRKGLEVALAVTGEGRELASVQDQTSLSEDGTTVMRERARMLGGRLDVITVGDRNTVEAVLPLVAKQTQRASQAS